MDISQWLMLATFLVSLVATLILPFILRALSRQDADRATLRNEFHARTDHLDTCIDSLRTKVLAEASTRADIAALEARFETSLNRMHISVNADTHGLHERIFRLESKFLQHTAADD